MRKPKKVDPTKPLIIREWLNPLGSADTGAVSIELTATKNSHNNIAVEGEATIRDCRHSVVLSFYASSRNKAKKIALLKKKLSILINSFQTALEYIEAAEARAKTPEALPQLPDYMDYE